MYSGSRFVCFFKEVISSETVFMLKRVQMNIELSWTEIKRKRTRRSVKLYERTLNCHVSLVAIFVGSLTGVGYKNVHYGTVTYIGTIQTFAPGSA